MYDLNTLARVNQEALAEARILKYLERYPEERDPACENDPAQAPVFTVPARPFRETDNGYTE
jgi:hypothetical protein